MAVWLREYRIIDPPKGSMLECTKNNYEIQRRVIKYPSLFNPGGYKTGEIKLSDLAMDELPCR